MQRNALISGGKNPAGQNTDETWRMPAEWNRHEATWLAWPHNARDWPGKIAPIHWVYGEIVRKLAPGEMLHILVNDAKHENQARRVLNKWKVDWEHVRFFNFPTNRGWTRDMGPIFVTEKKEAIQESEKMAIARFQFNGWAKYSNWQKDNAVPELAARELKCRLLPIERAGHAVVLEGGAIDVNGRGTIMVTEECLLDPEVQIRNPGFSKNDYEQVFNTKLGCQNVIWLNKGIAGDDTHGHVDDLARFVNEKTIVIAQESNKRDSNYLPLQENWERLEDARLEDGGRPEVVALPMPGPVIFDQMRLPASYANFYVGNAAVLVPTFNDEQDRQALGILGELFTDRPVLGIHAVDLVWGLGTLHCLTQQQPAI